MAQFIGKTITLISNSENRYVGILHEINSKDSTVSLRQVRSFGTEGRRNGVNEFPPSDGIFEYIIFRGSDVKDLKISDDPPPPQSQPEPVTHQVSFICGIISHFFLSIFIFYSPPHSNKL